MPETSQTGRMEPDEAPQVVDPAAAAAGRPTEPAAVVVDDLTVEDVSIDGMCGVY